MKISNNRQILIFILNIIILILNLFWISKELFKFPIENIFKYCDSFDFNIYKQSFYEIANYLNNKYNINKLFEFF